MRLTGQSVSPGDVYIGVQCLVVLLEKKMAIPGLPGGLVIYQGHLFPLKGHMDVYTTSLCFSTARFASKPGGVVVLLDEAPDCVHLLFGCLPTFERMGCPEFQAGYVGFD